jgi:uptake hydrogenase large subunit
MMTRALIERIEGEASLYLAMEQGRVARAHIAFPHFRGMEQILEGRKATDAMVIAPRVCGICGHAHLMAAVRAIESAYAAAGKPVVLTEKAAAIRELTLILEMIQNHFKWLYLVILPELAALDGSDREQTPLKGAFAASLATKILALFAGQWPHSSYMLPGGVTCDPTHLERVRAIAMLEELTAFFEKETAGDSLENVLAYESCRSFNALDSDVGRLERALMEAQMHEKGMAHDRFIVLGEHGFTVPSKLNRTRRFKADPELIRTEPAVCFDERTYADNVRYNGLFCEAGPLARAMAGDVTLIKNMHRRYKDSAYTRIMARVHEIALLLDHARTLLQTLPLSQPSFIPPAKLEQLSAGGVGIVEAPRGPLLHRVTLDAGMIAAYEIITPTQWNLGSAAHDDPAPAQKAMIGCSSIEEAAFVFRSFDVCSVCTTH